MQAISLHQNIDSPQVASKEASSMNEGLLIALREIISDNLVRDINGYHLSLNVLNHIEKKALLVHLLSPEEYEEVCQNVYKVDGEIEECKKYLQDLINQEVSRMYWEDVYENGGKVYRHKDNGESYVTR